MPDAPPDLSVVIPLRDESPNVAPLLDELCAVLAPAVPSFEIIAVDDGSTDDTFARLRIAHAAHPQLVAIRFTRNFGQSAAFAAGFAAARAPLVATMDGDLQNDPADLPRLIDLARTHDIVCGWRKRRRDDYLTRHVPSVVANCLIGLVTGVRLHDNGCSMKVFRAAVVKPLTLRPGMHRYLAAVASQLGGNVAEMVVNHRARRFGRSKYGLSRTFRVLADLVHLRRLMRQALEPLPGGTALYDVAETIGRPGRGIA